MAKTIKKTTSVKKSITGNTRDTSDLGKYYIDVQNPRRVYQLYMSEFSGLTPNNTHYYLDAARRGLNFWKSLLFEEIRRRDLRIGSVCQTRKLSVAKKKWSLNFSADSSLPEATQKEYKNFLNKNYDGVNFVQFITDIVEAQIQGVSTFEIVYKVEDSKYCLDEICYIPNYLLLFNDLSNEYRYLAPDKADVMNLRSISWNTSVDRIDLTSLQLPPVDPLKIIEAESLDGNAENGLMNGCIDSLIWAYMFKKYGLTDWSVYVERFASPGVIGKYPTLMNKTDKAKLMEAVRNWGNLFKATIPSECSLDLIDDTNKSSTTELFNDYINYWDKNISIRVLGQSLTTDIGDVGSKAASQTHNEVREDLEIADMILVSHIVNKLSKRLLDMNFATVTEYPKMEFEEEQSVDYKLKESEIMMNIKSLGYQVKREDVESKFGYEVEPVAEAEDKPSEENNTEDAEKYISKFIEDYFNAIQ